jgi:hypothetical protein
MGRVDRQALTGQIPCPALVIASDRLYEQALPPDFNAPMPFIGFLVLKDFFIGVLPLVHLFKKIDDLIVEVGLVSLDRQQGLFI